MRHFLTSFVIALAALFAGGLSMDVHAAAPKWENVPAASRVFEESPSDPQAEPEVVVKDGCIYVSMPRQLNIKVFTILGQLISQENLSPGVYKLQISAKGIYILKIGSITRRITL